VHADATAALDLPTALLRASIVVPVFFGDRPFVTSSLSTQRIINEGAPRAGTRIDDSIERPGLAVLLFVALAAHRLCVGPAGRRHRSVDDEGGLDG
jgi:hypothetical protein